jgi:hypothetical protein
MIVFQFGIETSQPTLTHASAGSAFPLVMLGAIAVFGALVGLLFVLRGFLRRKAEASNATFEMVTMLVTLPKFRREEESERGPTKEQVQELIAGAETFFSTIGGIKSHGGLKAWLLGRTDQMAFEIVVHDKLVHFYVTMPREVKELVEQQLSAIYPDAHMEEMEDYNIFSPTSVTLGSYLVLKRENAFPIKTYRKLDKDPLNNLTNVLAKIPEGEGAAFQFLLRPAPHGWSARGVTIARRMQEGMSLDEAVRGKKHGKGNAWAEAAGFGSKSGQDQLNRPEPQRQLSPLEQEVVKGLEEKASKAGMEVCIRLVASGNNAASAQTTLANMLNAFSQFNVYEYGNSFVKAVPPSKNKLLRHFIYRSFDEKYKIVMNAEELASLFHLPTPWSDTPNIKWLGARRAPAPANVPSGPDDGGQVQLGFNTYRGVKSPVWIKQPDRQRHMYIIGKSGSGKSELISSLAIQDIQAGRGVAVVDPHGDLVDKILSNVPRERIDDVVYFCPADIDRPMGLNMLEAKDESLKDFAVQEMIAIFYKLFPPEMIGPMFEHNMRNVMLTLMSDPESPGTIAEIPRMFSDEDYQKSWVAKVKDPVVRSFWENEMAKTSDFHKSEMLGYLISKVGRFVENEMMRNIIGQQRSSFDFRELMDQQKIFLCNLSKGRTGDVNAELLGLIIVSKLQMAALGRADMPEEQRKDFYLYIDEFQNFITDSIATILSEARKYRLDLIIAHQYIGQLVKNNDTKIRDAVFGNVGTMFTARIGPEDVDTLEKVYSPEFTGYDLINSDKFTWYVKMIVDNAQLKPFTLNFTPPPKGDREFLEAMKELSRLKYGRDRALVEAEILERSALGASPRGPQPPGTGEASL